MPPISVMIKPVSSRCNISCEYCFYRDVSSYRKQSEFNIMNKLTMKSLLSKVFDYANKDAVSVVFQGGEPTLAGIDYFKSFVAAEKELNVNKNPVFYSIQTNGILINDEWADFFFENKFLVGISLDGDFEFNKYRKDIIGNNTFNSVINACDILKKHNVDFNILSVITGHSAENGEYIYKFFKNNGFKYLQFVPCIKPFDCCGKNEIYLTNDQYADFLIRVFTLYVNDYLNGEYTSVRQFDNWIKLFLRQPAEQCGISGCCSSQFVCESNGNIYPCDFYCTDEYLLGNIIDNDFFELSLNDKATSFIKESMVVPERCKKCPYFRLCRAGGCKRIKQSEDYCEAYKKFFEICLPLFANFIDI